MLDGSTKISELKTADALYGHRSRIPMNALDDVEAILVEIKQ
jgi:hypothetical protein